MIVKYAPEDGTEQSWPYYPKKIRQSEAEMIEKRAGMTFDEFNQSLLTGSARSRRVILWHCLRKDHPVYRWEDVPDFAMSEVVVEFDASEMAVLRNAVVSDKSMDDDVRARALSALDEQIAAKADTADPKAS